MKIVWYQQNEKNEKKQIQIKCNPVSCNEELSQGFQDTARNRVVLNCTATCCQLQFLLSLPLSVSICCFLMNFYQTSRAEPLGLCQEITNILFSIQLQNIPCFYGESNRNTKYASTTIYPFKSHSKKSATSTVTNFSI